MQQAAELVDVRWKYLWMDDRRDDGWMGRKERGGRRQRERLRA